MWSYNNVATGSSAGSFRRWAVSCSSRLAARLLLLLLLFASVAQLLTYVLSVSEWQLLRGLGTAPVLDEPICPPSGGLISADKCGRLGNIMFEYAALLGANYTLGRPAWLLPKMADTLTAYFESLSTPVLPRDCRYNWTELSVEALINDTPKDGEDHLIVRYPTAVQVFQPLRQKVLREFTFRSELRASADHRLTELARQANVSSPTFIGVHVRRTDYSQWMTRYVDGGLVGADYLRRALGLMRRRHPDALFVVASDDLDWCRRELRAPDVVLAGDGVQAQPGGDLALLAACNHSVVTHGTFGFWAAYLAGGEVVKPTGYGTTRTGVEANARRANLNWTWIPAFSAGTTTAATGA